MMAVTSAIDLLRIANRSTATDTYAWTLVSRDGQPVAASNGVRVEVGRDLKAMQREVLGGELPEITFVCGGLGVEKYAHADVKDLLRALARRGRGIGGLCTGAWVLADAGLLDGRRCTIHWENMPGFCERFPEVEVAPHLCEIDENIYTSAGGTSSLDLVLHIIGQDFDEETVARVCEMSLVDRMRDIHDRQRVPLGARVGPSRFQAAECRAADGIEPVRTTRPGGDLAPGRPVAPPCRTAVPAVPWAFAGAILPRGPA